MSIHKNAYVTALVVVALALLTTMGLRAQTTDVPRLISYQGQVKTSDNSPLSGNHRVTIAFYSDKEGARQVWQGQYDVDVTGGVFNVLLGSGSYPLPDPKTMSQTLYVGITLDNGVEMRPLSVMAGVPYAMTVPDRSITKEKIATDFVGSISVNGKKITSKGSTLNLTDGENAWLNYDEKTGSISLNALSRTPDAKTQSSTTWDLAGNGGTTPGTDFLGTTDANELQIQVNKQTSLRIIPPSGTGTIANIIAGNAGSSSPNVISGTNIEGSTIAGGGSSGGPNQIHDNFDIIGGGISNEINVGGPYSAIGGGEVNIVGISGSATSVHHSFIGGGQSNTVFSSFGALGGGKLNEIHKSYGFVGGGCLNLTYQELSAIGGGDENEIRDTTMSYSFIGSGKRNLIYDSFGAIGGGDSNRIEYHGLTYGERSYSIDHSFIGGGYHNVINQHHSVIGGGARNRIFEGGSTVANEQILFAPASYSFIGGGDTNTILSDYCTIAGGQDNMIDIEVDAGAAVWPSSYSFIGGGQMNMVAGGCKYSVIGGGLMNFNCGAKGFIGGGEGNTLWNNSVWDVITGGHSNYIGDLTKPSVGGASIQYSYIGGGDTNAIGTNYSFIGGGQSNTIDGTGRYATIGGGGSNLSTATQDAVTIGGGTYNKIKRASVAAVIAGGSSNVVDNTQEGSIGGGLYNTVEGAGNQATIPGGIHLTANNFAQTVVGSCNILGDATTTSANFKNAVTPIDGHANQALFIVGNGTDDTHRTNAFEVSNNGHSSVFDVNNSGGATPIANPRPAFFGATYVDNIVYAWADVDFAGGNITVRSNFGVQSIVRAPGIFNGVFIVTLSNQDPHNPTTNKLSAASIVASLEDNTDPADSVGNCGYLNVSRIGIPGNNQFVVRTYDRHTLDCTASDKPFMFIVTGRP